MVTAMSTDTCVTAWRCHICGSEFSPALGGLCRSCSRATCDLCWADRPAFLPTRQQPRLCKACASVGPEARDITIRQAGAAEVDALADAHRDSINAIGPAFYSDEEVDAWTQTVASGLYLDAMKAGEVFFIAIGQNEGREMILGFSSDYGLGGTTHGTSVYVRGSAARRGIGSALLRRAEEHALADGAEMIEIQASLAGVAFYRRHGYEGIQTGPVRLRSGRTLRCVFMRKHLRV